MALVAAPKDKVKKLQYCPEEKKLNETLTYKEDRLEYTEEEAHGNGFQDMETNQQTG